MSDPVGAFRMTYLKDGEEHLSVIYSYETEAHDGPGWYWRYEEYPEEGYTRRFDSLFEAVENSHNGVDWGPG